MAGTRSAAAASAPVERAGDRRHPPEPRLGRELTRSRPAGAPAPLHARAARSDGAPIRPAAHRTAWADLGAAAGLGRRPSAARLVRRLAAGCAARARPHVRAGHRRGARGRCGGRRSCCIVLGLPLTDAQTWLDGFDHERIDAVSDAGALVSLVVAVAYLAWCYRVTSRVRVAHRTHAGRGQGGVHRLVVRAVGEPRDARGHPQRSSRRPDAAGPAAPGLAGPGVVDRLPALARCSPPSGAAS